MSGIETDDADDAQRRAGGLRAAWLIVAAGLALAGCGGSERGTPAPCEGVTCEVGTCVPEMGTCDGEKRCRRDEECRAGDRCTEAGVCEPATSCEGDDECEAGVCEQGVCRNPQACANNEGCLPDSHCAFDEDDGEGTCVRESRFCEVQTCERGVCSREFGRCVDAPDCAGEDARCLAGNYCSSRDRCRPDLCAERDVACPDGGVCDPRSGRCENAESCRAASECTEDHWCVDGTCRLEASACGDAGGEGGCPANQRCEYEADDLEASCAEPDECETSFDCREGRRCARRECRAAGECRADAFEPNDSPEEATSFESVTDDFGLRASLCPDDRDVYTAETGELFGTGQRGELVVEATILEADRGLGGLSVELEGPEGSQIADESTESLGGEGRVRVTTQVGAIEHGSYTIGVGAADGMRAPGVMYDLSVEFLSEESLAACEQPERLDLDGRTTGTTFEAGGSRIDSSCSSYDNPGREKIYAVEIDRPRKVRFDLEPREAGSDLPTDGEADLTMSLRERCTQRASERRCVDETGAGDAETMSLVLAEGTYYLVVQTAAGTSAAGRFELTVEQLETTCAPGSTYCERGETARVCRDEGRVYRSVLCDEGCEPATGRCRRLPGDLCHDAETISPEAAGSREFTFGQFTDDYRIDPADCDGAVGRSEGAAERVYRVEIPPETGFRVEATFDGGELGGRLYLARECPDVDDTCATGAQGDGDEGPVLLQHANRSGDPRTRYLVVEPPADEPGARVELEPSFREVVCTPGERQCGPDGHVERCENSATEWTRSEHCELGCTSKACRGESCGQAVEIPDDGSFHEYTFDLREMSNDLDVSPNRCTRETWHEEGGDAMFAVDLERNELLEVTWDSVVAPEVYVTSGCQAGNATVHCVPPRRLRSGSDRLEYVSESDGRHYVVAKAPDAMGARSVDLSARVRPRPCDPASASPRCAGSQQLEYCRAPGLWEPYACDGGCSGGRCGDPSGDVCADAIDVPRDGNAHTYAVDLSQHEANYRVDPTSCPGASLYGGDGREVVAKVDAAAGEIIDAGWEPQQPSSLAIVTDCEAPDATCVGHREVGSSVDLRYPAEASQTYYILADTRAPSDPSEYGTGELTVQVRQPTCTPHTGLGCDGDALTYCSSAGLEESVDCDGSCTAGSCDPASGEVCADPIPLEDGDVVGRTFTGGLAIPTGFGDFGNCTFDETTRPNIDDIYEIDLQANETLTVDYETGAHQVHTNAGVMYLTTGGCGELNTCQTLAGPLNTFGQPLPGALTYDAPVGQTVYLVVGLASNPSPYYDYEIQVSID